MGNKIMQETTPLVECSAFHRGMSVLEASLRNTEDSETIISGLLKGAAEFYGASRASVVEADWDLGIGVITYEWCKDGVPAQRDMLQCLPMEKFPRWRKALRANKPVVISDLQRLENVYPDEAAFFREYGVTTLLAAPFSKRINQGFIAVDDPTRYTDDPVFLFIASYAVVAELNEIKQQQSLLAATKASKYNPEDIHINFFGGMEIISSKGTLTGEDIKADQCYLLLAYLILNHKKNFSVDTLAEIICPYDELDSPYKVVNNIVYRLRRTLSVIGLDKLVIGKNGTFQINPNFNIHTDFDRFEDACIQLKTEENPDMRHSLYHSAVDMYKGQLLPRCEHELWLMQLSMYYQSLYLQITKGYVRLKMECKDYILAQKTAIDALRFDPKDSELNMYAILAMGFQGNLSMAQTYYTAAKPYSTMFATLESIMKADLPQMELYCEIGKAVCAHSEKGAAVAAAEFIKEQYPDMTGFSPRNVRRMRDFWQLYSGTPELLGEALHLNWTQNIVIMEAELPAEERRWYIRQATARNLSKAELLRMIEDSAYLESVLDEKVDVWYNEGNDEISERTQYEEDPVYLSWQYLPQPHGRVRDEGLGKKGGTGIAISYRISGYQSGGDRQPCLSSGTAQAGRAWNLLRRPCRTAVDESGLRRIRSPDRHGPGQPPGYVPHLRRRLCRKDVPPDGPHRSSRQCGRPVVHRGLRGDLAGCAGWLPRTYERIHDRTR